jgi:hypothetical protein
LRGADDGEDLVLLDVEGDAVVNLLRAVEGAEVFDFDLFRGGHVGRFMIDDSGFMIAGRVDDFRKRHGVGANHQS